MHLFRRLFLLVLLLILVGSVGAGELRVAVASNFLETAQRLGTLFEQRTGHRVLISSGSTGKLYAQIRHGAPHDLFLAADARRPQLLVAEGEAVAGSRVTYAVGQLVLWQREVSGLTPEQRLRQGDFRHLALGNPKTAPYGTAAREMLQSLGLWETLQGRMVFGENIGQAYQFAASGNAELGLVALSQLRQAGIDEQQLWRIPQSLYTPLQQQAVILKRAADAGLAQAFLDFLGNDPEARSLIERAGYGL